MSPAVDEVPQSLIKMCSLYLNNIFGILKSCSVFMNCQKSCCNLSTLSALPLDSKLKFFRRAFPKETLSLLNGSTLHARCTQSLVMRWQYLAYICQLSDQVKVFASPFLSNKVHAMLQLINIGSCFSHGVGIYSLSFFFISDNSKFTWLVIKY